MAKLILSALLSAIKGTYNGSTFQDWKGVQVLRRTPQGSPYISEYRSFAMGVFSSLSGCFYGLTSNQQDAWEDFADLASSVMSGFDAFIKLNVALLATQHPSLPLNVTAPQLYDKPDTPVYVSARYSRTKDRFIFNWASPAAVTTFVTAFSAVQTGYSNWKSPKWRSGVTVPASYNRCYFDVCQYPDAQVFRFRGRSIFQNGVFSSYSERVTALKSYAYSYPPFLYVTDFTRNLLYKYSIPGLSWIRHIGPFDDPGGSVDKPSGLCTDEDYLFSLNCDVNKVFKFYKDDCSYISSLGSLGTGDNNFDNPQDICCDETYIYICDSGNNRIKKHLKSDLSFVAEIGSFGSGDKYFNEPKGICIYGGYLYISDSLNDRICKYTCSTFEQLENFGTTGTGDLNFDTPVGITTDGTYLYIVDQGNDRIKKHLISDFSFVAEAGSSGSGNDNFDSPHGIAIDDSYIFIADYSNSRVIIRSLSTLAYIDKITKYGPIDSSLLSPKGLCTMTLYP